MSWNTCLLGLLTLLGGFGTFLGIVVDYEEAKTKLASLYPVIEALLPVIALGGVLSFGVGLFIIMGIIIYKIINTWKTRITKTDKFKAACLDKINSCLYEASKIIFADSDQARTESYIKFKELSDLLYSYKIKSPDDLDLRHENYGTHWYTYLIKLKSFITRHTLKEVQTEYPIQ